MSYDFVLHEYKPISCLMDPLRAQLMIFDEFEMCRLLALEAHTACLHCCFKITSQNWQARLYASSRAADGMRDLELNTIVKSIVKRSFSLSLCLGVRVSARFSN